MKRNIQSGKQNHKGSAAFCATKIFESGKNVFVQLDGQLCRSESKRLLLPVTAAKYKPRQGGSELFFPIVEPYFHELTIECALLPADEVSELELDFGQGRCTPSGQRFVDDCQLVPKHLNRPTVADDMMHGGQQHIFIL